MRPDVVGQFGGWSRTEQWTDTLRHRLVACMVCVWRAHGSGHVYWTVTTVNRSDGSTMRMHSGEDSLAAAKAKSMAAAHELIDHGIAALGGGL